MIFKLNKKPLKPISVKDFYEKRNKVLLIRNARGIGDILNCRMLFKDFKRVMPDIHLVFACWEEYHDLVKDHPYVDEVVNSRTVNKQDYIISYDISTCCVFYESVMATKNTKHRADIWAEHCGIEITDHNMLLPFINQSYTDVAKEVVKNLNKDNLPTVLFCPMAFEIHRSLTREQIGAIVNLLRKKGLFVYSNYISESSFLTHLGVPILAYKDHSEWFGTIHAADYVVTVDTSTFHYAGGIGKPLTGIFTHVDGKLRGKYYDFILVQKHRDNGNWPCGPCYLYNTCTNPMCKDKSNLQELRPCLTQLTIEEIESGIDKMLNKWKFNTII